MNSQDNSIVFALTLLENSVLWKSVSKLLKTNSSHSLSREEKTCEKTPVQSTSYLSKPKLVSPSSTEDSSSDEFSDITNLLMSYESRKPLYLLLYQLGYRDKKQGSLITRKLLSSIILLLFYEEDDDSIPSNTAFLMSQVKKEAILLWELIQKALIMRRELKSFHLPPILSPSMSFSSGALNSQYGHVEAPKGSPRGIFSGNFEHPGISVSHLNHLQIDSGLFSTLKIQIEKYLRVFDQWKENDLESLQSILNKEIDALENLSIATSNAPEWADPIASYSSLLFASKNQLGISQQESSLPKAPPVDMKEIFPSIEEQLKDNITLSRALTLYEIIIYGPQEYICKKISLGPMSIMKNPTLSIFSERSQRSEELIHFRSFHSTVVKKIKKALLDIISIGSLSWHKDSSSYEAMINEDYSSEYLTNSISLKNLVLILRKTLMWLSTIIRASPMTKNSSLMDEIHLLSTSMDAFYTNQSACSPTEAMVSQRKTFLISFYRNLEDLFHRTNMLVMEHAVSSLILPFISERSHLQEYFQNAYSAFQCSKEKDYQHSREIIESFFTQLEEKKIGSEWPRFLLFDYMWMSELKTDIKRWTYLLCSYFLASKYIHPSRVVEEKSLEIADKLDYYADPCTNIKKEWLEFIEEYDRSIGNNLEGDVTEDDCEFHSQKGSLLKAIDGLSTPENPLMHLILRRIQDSIFQSGFSLYEAMWKNNSNNGGGVIPVPAIMQTGRSSKIGSGTVLEWWCRWCLFSSELSAISISPQNRIPPLISIHRSFRNIPVGQLMSERIILPAATQLAKRTALHHILRSL